MTQEVEITGPVVRYGTHPARLAAMGVKEAKDGGSFRTWDFNLQDGSTASGTSSLPLTGKAKGAKWITALLGRSPVLGEKVNAIGARCLVEIGENNAGYETVLNVLPPLAEGVPAKEVTPEDGAALPF